MKKRLRSFLILCAICMAMILSVGVNAFAAERKLTKPGNAVKDGAYVYYSYNMGGLRQGIMRYNTVTKTKKTICDWHLSGKGTNGFSKLSVSGDYVYCVWNQFYGTAYGLEYIYRIKKDGTKRQKLAIGTSPVVVGSKIYYSQAVVKTAYNEKFTVGTGKIYQMNLDGTGKKLVREPYTNFSAGYELCRLGETGVAYYDPKKYCYCDIKGNVIPAKDIVVTGYLDAYYTASKTASGSTITSRTRSFVAKNGAYRYYLSSDRRTLYRFNTKTNTTNKVIALSGGFITNYTIADTYITVRTIESGSMYGRIYIVKNTGAGKVSLARWQLAE